MALELEGCKPVPPCLTNVFGRPVANGSKLLKDSIVTKEFTYSNLNTCLRFLRALQEQAPDVPYRYHDSQIHGFQIRGFPPAGQIKLKFIKIH